VSSSLSPRTRRATGIILRSTGLASSKRCRSKRVSAYAEALYQDPGATLDDLREAVTTLEGVERIARRVFGGTHPLTVEIEDELRDARAALLRARETPTPGSA
jgi:hypothetical protein